MLARTAVGRLPCTTTSETAKRPPGFSTQAASRSTWTTSPSRSGWGLIHSPGPSEPNPAQFSRVRTICRALRSPSGIRTATTSQRPSQLSVAPVNE